MADRTMSPTRQGYLFGRQMEEAKSQMELEMLGKDIAKAEGLNKDDLYLLRRTYAYYAKHGPWTNYPNEA